MAIPPVPVDLLAVVARLNQPFYRVWENQPLTGRSDQDVSKWFEQFEYLASLVEGVTDVVRFIELRKSVQEKARDLMLNAQPAEITDYAAARAFLIRRLSNPNQSIIYRQQFASRMKRKEESVEEYLGDLRKLVRQAFPAEPEEAQKLVLKERFIAGLSVNDKTHPNFKLWKVAYINMEKPLEEIVPAVNMAEVTQRMFPSALASDLVSNLNALASGSNRGQSYRNSGRPDYRQQHRNDGQRVDGQAGSGVQCPYDGHPHPFEQCRSIQRAQRGFDESNGRGCLYCGRSNHMVRDCHLLIAARGRLSGRDPILLKRPDGNQASNQPSNANRSGNQNRNVNQNRNQNRNHNRNGGTNQQGNQQYSNQNSALNQGNPQPSQQLSGVSQNEGVSQPPPSNVAPDVGNWQFEPFANYGFSVCSSQTQPIFEESIDYDLSYFEPFSDEISSVLQQASVAQQSADGPQQASVAQQPTADDLQQEVIGQGPPIAPQPDAVLAFTLPPRAAVQPNDVAQLPPNVVILPAAQQPAANIGPAKAASMGPPPVPALAAIAVPTSVVLTPATGTQVAPSEQLGPVAPTSASSTSSGLTPTSSSASDSSMCGGTDLNKLPPPRGQRAPRQDRGNEELEPCNNDPRLLIDFGPAE